VAEVPRTHLLAVQVAYIGICLAVLARCVAQLPQVRGPCHLQQLGFSTWGLGLRFNNFGCLRQGQLTGQEGCLGVWAVGQASGGLQSLAGLAGGPTHLAGYPCSTVAKATGLVSTTGNCARRGQ
jgi:hypothetical protein